MEEVGGGGIEGGSDREGREDTGGRARGPHNLTKGVRGPHPENRPVALGQDSRGVSREGKAGPESADGLQSRPHHRSAWLGGAAHLLDPGGHL